MRNKYIVAGLVLGLLAAFVWEYRVPNDGRTRISGEVWYTETIDQEHTSVVLTSGYRLIFPPGKWDHTYPGRWISARGKPRTDATFLDCRMEGRD
jgi:hypothetical protein